MAKCDEGYPCEVCGEMVEAIAESDLYLRYILGEVPLEGLHLQPERHLRCNPALAQYIVAEGWEPVACPGAFDKNTLAAEFVTAEEQRASRGYRRLLAIPKLRLALPEYPLAVTPDGDLP